MYIYSTTVTIDYKPLSNWFHHLDYTIRAKANNSTDKEKSHAYNYCATFCTFHKTCRQVKILQYMYSLVEFLEYNKSTAVKHK